MQERAIFISRTRAYQEAEAAARKAGYTQEEASSKCRVYPVYRRGEMRGFEAWFPHGTGARPVLEQ